METRWVLKGAGERIQALTRVDPGGRRQTVQPVLTVQHLCRLLRRSRRQVYRYLRSGRLQPCARILGQWLFDPEQADRFREQHLPFSLRPFFWDVRLSDLSAQRHRDFILSRLLEFGDRQAVRWALRTYPRDSIVAFLERRGASLLSKRAWIFWASQWGLRSRVGLNRWRRRGRHWGGIS